VLHQFEYLYGHHATTLYPQQPCGFSATATALHVVEQLLSQQTAAMEPQLPGLPDPLPKQARFLREIACSTATAADMERWARPAALLHSDLVDSTPAQLHQLASGGRLLQLLYSSCSFALQQLAAAAAAPAQAPPAAAAAPEQALLGDQSLEVLAALVGSAGCLLEYVRASPSASGQLGDRMRACINSSGEWRACGC
jgi:hypothetical protein